MDSRESLFYALGEFAYAIALADGKIQKQEKETLKKILSEEFKIGEGYDYSNIIFEILKKDKTQNVQSTYNWAMKEIKLNSHYLSPELKEKFIRVIKTVAEAFLPVTKEETVLLEKFKRDIKELKGDPNYYNLKLQNK